MNKKTSLFRLLRNKRGATSIEYAIIASGIAGALIATIGLLGTTVEQMWTELTASSIKSGAASFRPSAFPWRRARRQGDASPSPA